MQWLWSAVKGIPTERKAFKVDNADCRDFEDAETEEYEYREEE